MKNYIIIGLLIVLCISFLINCYKQTDLPIENNYLSELNQHWNKKYIESEKMANYYRSISDSLKSIKPAIKTKIITLYDKIHVEVPDSVKIDLDSLKFEYEYLEFINANIIEYKDSTIAALDSAIINLKKITHNDTIYMKKQSHKIDSLVNSNKKYWKGFKHGILTGIGLSGAIYVGSKIDP